MKTIGLKIENIDRAIEWAIRDEIIRLGHWPDQRTFVANNDQVGFNAALQAMGADKIDVFGVGNYSDRSQLKANNVIISREGPMNGGMGFSQPFRFELQTNRTYNKINSGTGSSGFTYEIRFVCDKVGFDRLINKVIQNCFGRRKYILGLNADLSSMPTGFDFERSAASVDLSGKDYIERLFPYQIQDILLDDDIVVETGIPMTTQIVSSTTQQNDGPDLDVEDPDIRGEIVSTFNPTDFFLLYLRGMACWHKFDVCRFYATDTEANALQNLRGGLPGLNVGLTFQAWHGYKKTAVGQYLNTLFSPQRSHHNFSLGNYSYAVFITSVPNAGIMEILGLSDMGSGNKFLLTSDADTIAIGNAPSAIDLSNYRVKADTLYVINRKSSYEIDLYENAKVIARMIIEPLDFPAGNIGELNVLDQTNTPVGTSITGGIVFSAIGSALKKNEIVELNNVIRFLLQKVGADIDFSFVEVEVRNGNVYYDNTNDPQLTLTVDEGNLNADGPSASNYEVDNGSLYYND